MKQSLPGVICKAHGERFAPGKNCTGSGQLFRVETDALTKTESPYQSFQPFKGLQWFQTVLIFPITSCSEACAGWYESPAQKGQLGRRIGKGHPDGCQCLES